MEFTKETVDKLANLLMIGLTEEENKMVLDEFEIIDSNINKINKIEGIDKVKPMTHALDDFKFSLREDVAEDSPSIEELLANCDQLDGREVEVPKVVD
ncbi:MAG: Asp-tRNA(Asn)/Glu-tRNA(Gln) amidotransferase subunit GatC [Bacilli bacterium]|nr:Asp-tRNA(Asn)/Glu-tRNA(Gln) amidotransferase subunit GatC [Bacilli bacterium]